MKIFWIVNMIFPHPAKKLGKKEDNFGGWLRGLSNNIIQLKDTELIIISLYNGDDLQTYNDGKIIYILIPNNKKKVSLWNNIVDKYKPDIIHIHGTEYAKDIDFIYNSNNLNIVISIQGLIYRYADVYYANIDSKEIIKNITLRDFIKKDNLFQQKKKLIIAGKSEKELIKKANAIIGRTMWDYANVKEVNPNVKYFLGNEILREAFYKKQWDLNNVDKFTLFCSQSSSPLKGLHYLLETVYILKNKYNYNNIKLYVAGKKIVDFSNWKLRIKKTGYAKYINKLIQKYELQENIIFTGVLNENEMIEYLLKTNVFVLPSAIENSSNSLCEAMILGMPCVASNTGGTMDMLEHEKEGFLYPYTEPAMCAEYISKIFKDNNLATELGEKAKKRALERHDQHKNAENVIKIYRKVIGDG